MPKGEFSAERLLRLGELEQWHFWFVGRRALLGRLLAKYLKGGSELILDAGCGTGFLPEKLLRRGYRVVGLDRRTEGIFARRHAVRFVQAEAGRLPFGDELFEAALLLDVLEHLDDREVLGDVRRVLRPGGWVIIMVPAAPWLWSYRDEAAGHRRRYRRRQLLRLIAAAELRVEEIRFYQCWLFPLAAVTRLLGRRGPGVRDLEECPLSILNRVLTWINRLEVRAGDFISWPWGTSLVAVCRKV
jgi:SAM-dependent methyltransferase